MSATATVLAGLLLILAGIVAYAVVVDWIDGREARAVARVQRTAAQRVARQQMARANDERERRWGG
jgi:hypothetical protein